MIHIPLGQKIRPAASGWRGNGHEGTSPVTKRLLEFWFKEEHWLKDGSEFKFWRAQRDLFERGGLA